MTVIFFTLVPTLFFLLEKFFKNIEAEILPQIRIKKILELLNINYSNVKIYLHVAQFINMCQKLNTLHIKRFSHGTHGEKEQNKKISMLSHC